MNAHSKIIEKKTENMLFSPRINKKVFDSQCYPLTSRRQQKNPIFSEIKDRIDMQQKQYSNCVMSDFKKINQKKIILHSKAIKRMDNFIQNKQNKNDKNSEFDFSFGK